LEFKTGKPTLDFHDYDEEKLKLIAKKRVQKKKKKKKKKKKVDF